MPITNTMLESIKKCVIVMSVIRLCLGVFILLSSRRKPGPSPFKNIVIPECTKYVLESQEARVMLCLTRSSRLRLEDDKVVLI